jgi:hypothetical protein
LSVALSTSHEEASLEHSLEVDSTELIEFDVELLRVLDV